MLSFFGVPGFASLYRPNDPRKAEGLRGVYVLRGGLLPHPVFGNVRKRGGES